MQHERAVDGGKRRFNKMYKKYNQTAVPPIDLNLFRKLSHCVVQMEIMLLIFRWILAVIRRPSPLDTKQFTRYTIAQHC